MVLGTILIIIGIIGLVVPVLNGVVFLLLGFILLSFESPFVEAQLQRFANKNKHTALWYHKLNIWMRKVFGK